MGRQLTLAIASLAVCIGLGNSQANASEACVRITAAEWAGENMSIDPAVNLNQSDYVHVNSIYEPLVWIDEKFQPQPFLATSWESNDDSTIWTFHLREGVKFHDGSGFDAGDVVHTYRRVLDPNGGVAANELTFVKPEGVTAKDEYTVEFKLETPVVELPTLIGNKFAYISAEGSTAESLARHGNGTGPFMLREFSPGGPKTVLERNPNYWQSGLPKAPCLEFSGITEALPRAEAVKAGDVDVALVVDPATIPNLQTSPTVKLAQAEGGTFLNLSMWVDTPPFDDARIRAAMKLVIDRQAIVDTALLGFGIAGNDSPIPPNSPDTYRTDTIPRDVEKAKALLAEAGHSDGLAVDLYTADHWPGVAAMVQAYQQMAAEAGIKVNIINTPASSYWDVIWLKKPFITSYWSPRATSAMLSTVFRKNAKYNETHWYRDDFDALLDKADATRDPQERRRLYQEAQRMLADEGGMIIPAFTSIVSALRSQCSGYKPHPDQNRYDFKQVACQ